MVYYRKRRVIVDPSLIEEAAIILEYRQVGSFNISKYFWIPQMAVVAGPDILARITGFEP
jgi:hypothetical protein